MAPTSTAKIDSSAFYGEWHGHRTKHLNLLLPRLREQSDALIWTAGDSSLDNKYWFSTRRPAVPGAYADLLQPPTSVADVTYWLNHLSTQRKSGTRYIAINTAVEATTLNERCFKLRPQDLFIRDHLERDDVLIVSVGGNDIAMAPSPCTIASVAGLLCLPQSCLERGRSFGAVPLNDCCCGFGASLASCGCSCPPCLGYFRHLFGTRTQLYIEALTSKTKPKKILVCMIYYPDEKVTPSWANTALGALQYNTHPEKVQFLLRKIFEEASSKILIEGSEVIPIPLFHPLDGSDSSDYVARVEPSAVGGKKMAEFFLDAIHSQSPAMVGPVTSAPTSSLMSGRSA